MKLSPALFLAAFAFLFTTACVTVKNDNGKKKGWTKNTNNPHHPASTNPGKAKQAQGQKPKSK